MVTGHEPSIDRMFVQRVATRISNDYVRQQGLSATDDAAS